MEINKKVKDYMQRLIKGEKASAIAYSAIENDDNEGLAVLIDCGLDLLSDNFVFAAIDSSANKCFDVLLEKNANLMRGGRAYDGTCMFYVEPLEYAVIINNMNYAKKLIAHGAPLTTQGGIDILRKYGKYIGGDNCDILREQRALYVSNQPQIER